MNSPHRSPTVWAIVVGGGSGQRFGAAKQFAVLDGDSGERVIDRSVRVAASVVDQVVIVVPPQAVEDETRIFGSAANDARFPTAVTVVAGGGTRAHSVANGLSVVPDGVDIVCVHDAARPLASPQLYRAVIDGVERGADGVVPGLAMVDTVKTIDADGVITGTPDRASLVTVQTPQAFAAPALREAHAHGDPTATDDAMLVEAAGGCVRVVDGERTNIKITHPDDLAVARRAVAARTAPTGEGT